MAYSRKISYKGRHLRTRCFLQRTVKVVEVLVERSKQRALRIRVQPAHSHVDIVSIKLTKLVQPRRSAIRRVPIHTPIVRPGRHGVRAVQHPHARADLVQPPRRARAPEALGHARCFEEPARDAGVKAHALRARAPPVDEERDGEDGLGVRGVVARARRGESAGCVRSSRGCARGAARLPRRSRTRRRRISRSLRQTIMMMVVNMI